MKHLTVEEVKARQDRLAKMRALLFYQELKAKRLKSIKSKGYHKRLAKAEKRRTEKLGKQGECCCGRAEMLGVGQLAELW